MTRFEQDAVQFVKWLANACKECCRAGTSVCEHCPSAAAVIILERYKEELKVNAADGSRLSKEKARFLVASQTMFKVEAHRPRLMDEAQKTVHSRKVGWCYLTDLVRRGYLELSADGATVALTPMGLEFIRAEREKDMEQARLESVVPAEQVSQ